MKSLTLNLLAVTLLSFNAFSDCHELLKSYDNFTPKPLVSYEQLNEMSVLKIDDFLANRPQGKELIQKGKDIFNASKKLRSQSVVNSTSEELSTYMMVPSNQEFIELAKIDLAKDYLNLLAKKKAILIKANKQLEQEGLRSALTNKTKLETLSFWKNKVESKLDSLLSYIPDELKSQLEGVEIAYKSFQSNISGKISNVGSTRLAENLIVNELSITSAKAVKSVKKEGIFTKLINKIRGEKETNFLQTQEDLSGIYGEIQANWERLGSQSKQAQDKSFEPILDLLDNLDRHFTTISPIELVNDPIFKIHQELSLDLKNHFKITKVDIIAGETKFNADIHSAISAVEIEGRPAGLIEQVIQSGYQKPNKVLRYPKVIVTK